MPIVRITPPAERRSALAILKELFTIAPVWVKALGALTAAMLVLAVIGADIRIGHDGFNFQANLFRRTPPSTEKTVASNQGSVGQPPNSLTEPQVRDLVGQMILESERKRALELDQQLVRLESGLK